MASLNQARERIYQHFATAWGSTSAFTFENEKFAPPSGAAWVRLSVRHRVRGQETLGPAGNRKFESFGAVIVQVFTPLDNGTAAADTLAELVRTTFEGKVLLPEHIRVYAVGVREVGPSDEWHQVNVEAEFQYDETK